MVKRHNDGARQPFLLRMRVGHHLDNKTPGPARVPFFRISKARLCVPSWHSINKFWVIEALASFFAITLFAIIVTILHCYDGKEYGTTSAVSQGSQIKRPGIYPIISFLSAVLRACMLLPVATAIGQLKWTWFRRKRTLTDLEQFDEASRGMMGSLSLLWTVRCRAWVAVGAALMILTLPIDALIQNTVLLPQRKELNTFPYHREGIAEEKNGIIITTGEAHNITNTTNFAKSSRYTSVQYLISPSEPRADTPMINAIHFGLSFLSGFEKVISPYPVVDCPTGYCEFGLYQTLGVGGYCTDRSADVERIEAVYPFWTIHGTNLYMPMVPTDHYEGMEITARSYTTHNLRQPKDNIPPLISRTAILVNSRNGEKPAALECFLFWHPATFTSYINTTASPHFNATHFSLPWTWYETNSTWRYTFTPSTCYLNNHSVTRAQEPSLYDEECIHAISATAHTSLQSILLDPQIGLNGDSLLLSRDTSTNETRRSPMNHFIANINALIHRPGTNRDVLLLNMNQTWNNIAAAMTHIVRQNPIFSANGTARQGVATGMVYQYVFYYKISWWRITPAAVLVLACTVFVGVTAWTTRGEVDWRRSNLPLFFYGLGDRERDGCGEVRRLIDMEGVAERMCVRLVGDVSGVKLARGSILGERYDADV